MKQPQKPVGKKPLFRVGDVVRVKRDASDYHVEGMRGYKVLIGEIIPRSKDWTQYKIIWGEDNWEIADENDLIKIEYL